MVAQEVPAVSLGDPNLAVSLVIMDLVDQEDQVVLVDQWGHPFQLAQALRALRAILSPLRLSPRPLSQAHLTVQAHLQQVLPLAALIQLVILIKDPADHILDNPDNLEDHIPVNTLAALILAVLTLASIPVVLIQDSTLAVQE